MTKVCRIAQVIILTFIIFIGCVCGVWADDVGTIITKSDVEYKSVKFLVDKNYRVVTIYRENYEKNISFTNIKFVYNSNGDDITTAVLGGYYKPQKETWLSETEPKSVSYRTKSWYIGFRLGSNFSIPITDYYYGIDPGIGFEGDLFIAATNEIDIRFMISKSGMKISEEFRNPFYSMDPNVQITDQDFNVFALRYVVAVQYHRRLTSMTPNQTIFYTYTGLGAINHSFDLKLTAWDSNIGQSLEMSSSSSETDAIWNFGFGMIILLSKKIGADFCGNFDMVFAGSGPDGRMQYAYIIDIKIGLVALL